MRNKTAGPVVTSNAVFLANNNNNKKDEEKNPTNATLRST